MVSESSDIYYSADIDGSNEIMFSFGVKGAHNTIGNLKLEKEKYKKIKKSLLEQISDELEKTKDLRYNIFNLDKNTNIKNK